VLIKRRTVVKHEAMAVRLARLRLVGSAEPNLDAREATHLAGPPERFAERERAHRSLAALASLKPAETRALVLQAAGRSYRDIEAETGRTSTKVNRALTEGRAALRERLAAIDAGTDCARHAHHLPVAAGRPTRESDRDPGHDGSTVPPRSEGAARIPIRFRASSNELGVGEDPVIERVFFVRGAEPAPYRRRPGHAPPAMSARRGGRSASPAVGAAVR
jgi:hypothetical protein